MVIAGTGVAVTLVGATTGQFHGTIKPNQSAVPQKSTSNSAVRQLLNATNSASASFAMATPSLSYAVPRHEVDAPWSRLARPRLRRPLPLRVLVPLRFRRLTCVTSGWRRAAPGCSRPGAGRAQHGGAGPHHGAGAHHCGPCSCARPERTGAHPGRAGSTVLVPTTTPAPPTTTVDQPSSMVAAPLQAADQATYSPGHPFDGHGRSWRHWGATGGPTATAGPEGDVGRPFGGDTCGRARTDGGDHAPRARAGGSRPGPRPAPRSPRSARPSSSPVTSVVRRRTSCRCPRRAPVTSWCSPLSTTAGPTL